MGRCGIPSCEGVEEEKEGGEAAACEEDKARTKVFEASCFRVQHVYFTVQKLLRVTWKLSRRRFHPRGVNLLLPASRIKRIGARRVR